MLVVAANREGRPPLQPVDARTLTKCMEQLQEAYVQAVASTAGCFVQPVLDMYGVDKRLIRTYRPPREETPVEVQLKSTTTMKPDVGKSWFSYQFKQRKYMETLAEPRKWNKLILIVMAIHPVQAQWASADHDVLKVHHCCYWYSLEGLEVPPGVAQPTVRIPVANVFDARALTEILDRVERGEALRD